MEVGAVSSEIMNEKEIFHNTKKKKTHKDNVRIPNGVEKKVISLNGYKISLSNLTKDNEVTLAKSLDYVDSPTMVCRVLEHH